MSDPNADSITERLKIACGTCGAVYSECSPDCSRHAYRPAVALPAFSMAESVAAVMLSGYAKIAEPKPAKRRKGAAK